VCSGGQGKEGNLDPLTSRLTPCCSRRRAAAPRARLNTTVGLAVTGVPLSGLAVVFGEEYGWQGFLQDEWVKLGKRRGVLVVGLGLVFFVLWGFVQSYAALKARSIWVAAFLHGVVNSVYAFMLGYVVHPDDKVLSFGLGVYGLACLALVVLFVLRDSIWVRGRAKGRDESWSGGGASLRMSIFKRSAPNKSLTPTLRSSRLLSISCICRVSCAVSFVVSAARRVSSGPSDRPQSHDGHSIVKLLEADANQGENY
jgi:hypothetical protein